MIQEEEIREFQEIIVGTRLNNDDEGTDEARIKDDESNLDFIEEYNDEYSINELKSQGEEEEEQEG